MSRQQGKIFCIIPCSKVWFVLNFIFAASINLELRGTITGSNSFKWTFSQKFKSLKWSDSAVTRHSQGYSIWPSRPQVSFSFRWIRNPESGGPSLAVIFLLLKQLLNYLDSVRSQDNLVIFELLKQFSIQIRNQFFQL